MFDFMIVEEVFNLAEYPADQPFSEFLPCFLTDEFCCHRYDLFLLSNAGGEPPPPGTYPRTGKKRPLGAVGSVRCSGGAGTAAWATVPPHLGRPTEPRP